MLVYQRVLENHTGSIMLKNEDIYIATYGKYMANIGIIIGIRIWDHTGKIGESWHFFIVITG